jgi:hypothetical protein
MARKLAGLFALVMVATARGETAALSRGEIEAELFGVRLSGVVAGTATPWSECISPAGRTVYRIAGTRVSGRLEIRDGDQACFRYDGPASCFTVHRDGAGYRFVGPGADFIATRVERGVDRCVANEAFT